MDLVNIVIEEDPTEVHIVVSEDFSFGYVPEDVANKATDFTTVNNTLYPSVLAVVNYGAVTFAAVGHNHDATYAALGHNHDATYAAIGHTHIIANVTGLQDALDAKQATLVSGTNIRTVNGNTLLGNTDLVINSMVYPGAGIALSTGSAWGTSITNNSANWNTAYGWGNHSGLYLPITGGTLTGHLLFTDNTYDIGASGATRPRTGYFATSLFSPSLTGSISVSGTLTLSSTSHATKGKILLGTSAYDEANNRLGIGTASPTLALDIYSTTSGSVQFMTARKSDDVYTFMRGSVGGGWSGFDFGRGDGGVTYLYNYGSHTWLSNNLTLSSSYIGTAGKLYIASAPTLIQTYGLVSRGDAGFLGSANHFSGSANGTVDAINISGSADFANWQKNGVSKFKFDNSGVITTSGGANFGGSVFNASGSLTMPSGISWHATGYYINYNNNFGYNYLNYGGSSASSGSYSGFTITNQTIAQTGTAAWTDFVVNRAAQSSVGSGAQYLLDLQHLSVTKFHVNTTGEATASKYFVSALNTAPSSASDTGTLGEIRFTNGYLYLCSATNTWLRAALLTW